jgi:hypothetical protein
MRHRLAAFPTQLTLTLAWTIIGIPVSLWLRSSILWVSLMSVYAIVVSHWTAHTAWKAERAAEHGQA